MSVTVKKIKSTDTHAWDTYVYNHPHATLYHLSSWKNVIERTYGHKTYYLMGVQSDDLSGSLVPQPNNLNNATNSTNPNNRDNPINPVVGILPLVHLKHFLFDNSLISIPFFDLGGILAHDVVVEKALLSEAINLGQQLKVKSIELRHTQPLSWLNETNSINSTHSNPSNSMNPVDPITYATKSHKVRMLLDLPESSEKLMKSFKSKLRSQIRKPIKEGLNAKIGGLELLDDFYNIFSVNMRNLGSPVHSRKLMQNVLEAFAGSARIVVVCKGEEPVACSMIAGFKDTLENPWASALREYSRLSPNMLLYWTMLEYACNNGYAHFDFGRSSPDEGTYKFKKQWGAKPETLYWHCISLNGHQVGEETSEKSKFKKAISYWQKMPVPVTKIIGPMIRKHIGL
jgi:FemAB-related protein (PEP-CTERM system-associated)